MLLEFDSLAQYSAMLRVIPVNTGHLVCPLRLGLPLSATKIAIHFSGMLKAIFPPFFSEATILSCMNHVFTFHLTIHIWINISVLKKQLHMPSSRPKTSPEKHLPADPRVVRWPLRKRICNEVMSFLPFRRFRSVRVDMLERYVFSGKIYDY